MDASGNVTIFRRRSMLFMNYTEKILSEEPSLGKASDILFSIVLASGITANIIVLSIILKNRRCLLKIPSNILLLNVAIADILSSVKMICIRIVLEVRTGPHFSVSSIVKSDWLIASAEIFFSHWAVMALAFFSFFATVYPMRFRAFATKKKVWMTALAIWLLSIVLTLPLIVVAEFREYVYHEEMSLRAFLKNGDEFDLWYIMGLALVTNVPPFVAVICLYPAILIRLGLQKKKNRQVHQNVQFHGNIDSSMKHITIVYAFFLLYVSCDAVLISILYHFISTDVFLSPLSRTSVLTIKFVIVVFDAFQCFHAVLNPFMHALLTEKFKKYYVPNICNEKTESLRGSA